MGLGGTAFVLKTDAAEVDLKSQTVTSSVGVVGAGERGTVAADAMTAYQDSGVVVLEGNVKMRLNPAVKSATEAAGLR